MPVKTASNVSDFEPTVTITRRVLLSITNLVCPSLGVAKTTVASTLIFVAAAWNNIKASACVLKVPKLDPSTPAFNWLTIASEFSFNFVEK